jgi:hypothetical protein
MNDRKHAKEALDQALRRLGRPPTEDMEAARDRVRQSLRSKAESPAASLAAEPSLDARPASLWRLRHPVFIPTAAVLGRLGSPSVEDMEQARERVRQSLRSNATGLPGETAAESLLDTRPANVRRLRRSYVILVAVLALAVLLLVSIYALTVAKGAPKLVPSADACRWDLTADALSCKMKARKATFEAA